MKRSAPPAIGSPGALTETDILGPRTRLEIVRADRSDQRPGLSEAPVCSLLTPHQIVHTGIIRAAAPFRIVRMNQSGDYFMATLRGEGRVLVDGEWQVCRPGTAFLLPRFTVNAFHAVRGRAWEFCYVRYFQPPQQHPISNASSPVHATFVAEPLRDAIDGLFHECNGPCVAGVMFHWVELIHQYVLRFAQPRQTDARLWKLWARVITDLAAPWTLTTLAREAHMSGEHLRRLCHEQLGRSPVQQLISLRMHRAAELLVGTNDKLEVIARAVGYQSPFTFSNTFKQWMGWSPVEFRHQRRRP